MIYFFIKFKVDSRIRVYEVILMEEHYRFYKKKCFLAEDNKPMQQISIHYGSASIVENTSDGLCCFE